MCHGRIYAIDLDRGLLVLKNDEFVPVKDGFFLNQKRVSVILPFDDKLLIGTRNDGLYLYDNERFTPFQTEADFVFKNYSLYEGLISRSNRIVLTANSRDGIHVLNRDGSIHSVINQDIGLSSGNYLNIFEDHQGSLWIGMQEGISRVDYNAPYSVYDDRSGLNGTIQGITSFQNEIYGASSEGLIKINALPLKDSVSTVGNINSYCWEIEKWNDQLIIASSNGAYALMDDKMTRFQTQRNFVSAIGKSKFDSSAILLVLDEGLSYQQWDGTRWKELGWVTGLSGSVRDVIEKEKGVFWLKTRSNGVFQVRLASQGSNLNFDESVIYHYNETKGVPVGENNFFKVGEKLLVRTEQDSLYAYDESVDRFVKDTIWRSQFGFDKGNCFTKKQNG